MAFNIPNAADAEDISQAQIDNRDFGDILFAAMSGTGVVAGCAVTAQAVPNMTVAVAGGTVAVAGTQAAVVGGNVTITAADATNPRFDLICADAAGAKSAVAGTPSSSPVFPNPAGKVVLAAVRVPAAATSINSQKIVDKRVTPVIATQAFIPGMEMMWASAVAPTGWLIEDGSAVSRTTYASLFALIGTLYGIGDGATTFNLPDKRGRVPVGYAAAGGHSDVSNMGANEGSTLANRRPKHPTTNGLGTSHSLTLPNHQHSVPLMHQTNVQTGGVVDAVVASGGNAGPTNFPSNDPNSNPAINGAVSLTGSLGQAGSAADTPAYIVTNFIIKT